MPDTNPNTNNEMARLAGNIASVLVGGGIIGLVLYFFDVELLISVFVWILLPIALLGLAVGMVSWGTISALFTGAFRRRVLEYYQQMKEQEAREQQATT